MKEKGNKWEGREKAIFISLQRDVGDFFACLLYLSSCLLLNNKHVLAENLCCDIYISYWWKFRHRTTKPHKPGLIWGKFLWKEDFWTGQYGQRRLSGTGGGKVGSSALGLWQRIYIARSKKDESFDPEFHKYPQTWKAETGREFRTVPKQHRVGFGSRSLWRLPQVLEGFYCVHTIIWKGIRNGVCMCWPP